ncbi:MAG: DUF7674 family protein [Bdellovibrionia bacterium]
MIQEKDCMEALLQVAPEFKARLEAHLLEWGSESNLHFQMAEFSYFIKEKFRQGDYSNAPQVFARIEFLLSGHNASEKVKNAVCTCFLENLINAFSEELNQLKIWIPLLGPESREYCKAWDQFTGVKTPGLWD